MGALTSLALGIAPELGRWLFGETAEYAIRAVAQAVQQATGTADPAAARAALAADPQAASQLRLRLAEIAADMAEKARKMELDGLAAGLRDLADARVQALALAVAQRSAPEGAAGGTRSPMVWGAPVVSVVVLVAFGGAMALALLRTIPPGSEAVLNVLLGTLAAMATSVVNYWVGSSAGSARKEAQLEQRR